MEDLLTAKDISGILGLHVNTIQNKKWQQRSGCPLIKKGQKLYVFASDFKDWMKKDIQGTLS